MPTGYTADLPKTFPEFALRCARAFGATIEMRDSPMDAPIPKQFKPDDYHAKALKKAQANLLDVLRWTEADAERETEKSYQKELKAWQERQRKNNELRQQYLAMLAEVKVWIPPTKDHVEMKRFMREQLEQSMGFDCSNEYDQKPKRMSGSFYKAEKIRSLKDDIDYAIKHDAEERERAAGRTKWVCDLRESLSQMEHVISISPDGTVRTLYTDKIDLRDFGTLHVERASNVEWNIELNGWTVQFPDGYYLAKPYRGWCCGVHAVLGLKPEVFETREEALKAEVDYLQARL